MNLEEPIRICKLIEPILRTHNYHCAIGGSRVHGISTGKNDIDIVIHAHAKKDGTRDCCDYDLIQGLLTPLFPDVRPPDNPYSHPVLSCVVDGTVVDFIMIP